MARLSRGTKGWAFEVDRFDEYLIPRLTPSNANTLPPDLTSGSYEFRDLTNKAIGTLFEGKVIYDKTYGHVAYGCAQCCGVTLPE